MISVSSQTRVNDTSFRLGQITLNHEAMTELDTVSTRSDPALKFRFRGEANMDQ